jgi:hypothetical protein
MGCASFEDMTQEKMSHSDDARGVGRLLRLAPREVVPQLVCGNRANVRAVMRALDCGCGCHLEGKDELCLTVKVLLHLEAKHPEIEEPTIELAEEMVAAKAYDRSIPSRMVGPRLAFQPYARQRMKVRGISEAQVRETVGAPHSAYASRFAGRIVHDRDFGSHTVRVVFDVVAGGLEIITATLRKRGRQPAPVVCGGESDTL